VAERPREKCLSALCRARRLRSIHPENLLVESNGLRIGRGPKLFSQTAPQAVELTDRLGPASGLDVALHDRPMRLFVRSIELERALL
jgi:hypothetical protein